jgi:hypothetical protein
MVGDIKEIAVVGYEDIRPSGHRLGAHDAVGLVADLEMDRRLGRDDDGLTA